MHYLDVKKLMLLILLGIVIVMVICLQIIIMIHEDKIIITQIQYAVNNTIDFI
jgi:hypothetical protein